MRPHWHGDIVLREKKRSRTQPMSLFLKVLIAAGVAVGAALTALRLLASWWPALDIVNNGLPLLTAGAVLLLCLALFTRNWRHIVATALLAAVNAGLLFAALPGAAPDAAPGSARFLRIATFNLWRENDRMDDVARFLAGADPDVIVLEEVTRRHGDTLFSALGSRYPHHVGDAGLVILSKHAIIAEGRIDRAGYPPWISLMVRWVRLEVNGTAFEVAGVHLTRPFYPDLQLEDFATLTAFVQSQSVPLVVAGDFNMTPWTRKLARFTQATGLKRHNTFHLTWPMRFGNIPLLPLVAIDNVFTSPQFAAIATEGGPRLGSDHRPVIADIALAKP